MPTCEELTHWIASDELAEAKWSVRLSAWIHLLVCRRCRRYAVQIRAIGAAARRWLRGRSQDRREFARFEAKILDGCRGKLEDNRSS